MEITLDTIRDIKVLQHARGYRFSLDSVLLSSFVELERVGAIADLGAGSGVVGLMLAARYEQARVKLIELQGPLHELCIKNIAANGLTGRVEALHADIRALPPELTGQFDLVVTNPPYRKPSTGRMSEGAERTIARHEVEITLAELLGAGARLLRARGRFCVVYHPGRLVELFGGMRAMRLEPKRMRFVHGRADLEAKVVLVEAVKDGRDGLAVDPPLFVYERDGKTYTDAVRAMCDGA